MKKVKPIRGSRHWFKTTPFELLWESEVCPECQHRPVIMFPHGQWATIGEARIIRDWLTRAIDAAREGE